MTGFKTVTQTGLVLAVGQQLSLPLHIEVGQVAETVNVTADTPLLDTSSVSSGQNFDSRMVEGLPMFSNMPIMLTRFAAGVNPSTNQSLVSQGFADGTTQAAGAAFGGVGSNNYSIDGATNNGSGRRIAASPNSDMIQEMRVESSNFDASVGHGTGLQISMMTRAGANQFRGTANYQYWSNKFNELNPSQRLTFTPAGKALYESGRSHNLALTLGGPVVIPKIVDGRNKLFFFGSYSYVNDFIPGKNQGSSTVPASAAQLNGDFSDLLRLPNPAQYQIYDPLTVRPDPANPNRFIRDPFPNNIIPANRIVNPLYNLYRQMVPPPNQNLIENGTTPTDNYYRGGEPDKPVSSLVRRPPGLQLVRQRPLLLPRLGQHVHRAGERLDLRGAGVRRPALDRSVTLQLGGHRQLDARGRQDAHRHPGREQPLLPGRPVAAAARVQADRHGPARLPRRLLRGAERLHVARRHHRRLSGHLARRCLRRHDDEPAGHGQPHAGARARTRCAGVSMRDSRSASAVRAATRPGSSRSPTSSPVRPATPRSSHRATSG